MVRAQRCPTAIMMLLGAVVLLIAGVTAGSHGYPFAGLRYSMMAPVGARLIRQHQRPLRVASVSLASDTILLRLLGAEGLCAVSWVVDVPEYSPHAGAVPAHIPRLGGDSESVIALEPDLAVVADHSAFGLGSALRAAGVKTLELTAPRSLGDVINDVRRVATQVNESREAERWSTELQARIRAVEAHAARRRRWRALVVNGGFAQAIGTLAHDLLVQLNATNPATESGLQGGVALDAERLLSWRPDVVFVVVAGAALVPDARAELLTHVAGHELLQRSGGWVPRRVVGMSQRELGAVSPLAVNALEAMDLVLEELQP